MQAIKFGFELETAQAGASEAWDLLRREGLTISSRQCSPHCQCPSCVYDRKEGLLAFQSDGGNAEFVTRILSTKSARDRKELKKFVALYPEFLDAMGWRPDGHRNVGNHVHVGLPTAMREIGRSHPGYFTMRAKVFTVIQALFASEPELWRSIADGGCARHRDYNGVCTLNDSDWGNGFNGNWLSDRGHNTIEFRLWNTPLDPIRLLAHPAISTALLTWAFALIDEYSHTDTFAEAGRAVRFVRGRVLPERKRIAGLIGEIWADKPSARVAAELVAA